MRLTGALSNPDALAPLLRLDRIRATLVVEAAKTSRVATVLKPRNGTVQAAILVVLRATTDPLAPVQVHALVERHLDRAVVRDSVSSFLSVACRDERSPVVRVQRGLYRVQR